MVIAQNAWKACNKVNLQPRCEFIPCPREYRKYKYQLEEVRGVFSPLLSEIAASLNINVPVPQYPVVSMVWSRKVPPVLLDQTIELLIRTWAWRKDSKVLVCSDEFCNCVSMPASNIIDDIVLRSTSWLIWPNCPLSMVLPLPEYT